MMKQQTEYQILLDNIPECVLKLRKDGIWKKIKDVMRSSISERPRDPAEINTSEGPMGTVAYCSIRNADYAFEAYENLQGMEWATFCHKINWKQPQGIYQNLHGEERKRRCLRAWLLEKPPNDSPYLVLEGLRDPSTDRSITPPVRVPPAQSPRMTHAAHQAHERRTSSVSSSLSSSSHSQHNSFQIPGIPLSVYPETPHRAIPRGLLGNISFAHNARATEAYSGDHFPGYMPANSTNEVNQALAKPSRSSSISTTSSRHPGSPKYTAQPSSPGTTDQPRPSYRSGSSSLVSNPARNAHCTRSSNKSGVNYYKYAPKSNDSSRQTHATAILRPDSNIINIEIHHLECRTSIEGLCYDLCSSMRLKRDFAIVKGDASKGKARASLEFSHPSFAEQAIRKLEETKIAGIVVNVIREDTHTRAYQNGDRFDEKAKRGPIIIDGSRTD